MRLMTGGASREAGARRARVSVVVLGAALLAATGLLAAASLRGASPDASLAAQPAPARAWLPLAASEIDLADLDIVVTAVPRVTATPGTVVPPTPRPSASPATTATPTLPSGSPTATLPPGLPTPDLGAGVPECVQTQGDRGGLRISLDDGESLLPNATRLAPLAYTWDIDVDPRDADVLLQLHQGRLFRSRDAGCTFAELPGVPSGAWDKLARAPSRPEVWVLASVFESRLAWTADDGATWTTETLPDDVVHFAIDPGDDGFIGPGPGPVPVSRRAGDRHRTTGGAVDGHGVAQDEPEPDPAFTWTFAGRRPFLYTRDASDQKWELKAIPLSADQGVISAAHGRKRLADGGMRWVVGSNTRGLWRSDDGGDSWREINDGLFADVGDPPIAVSAVVPAWISIAPSNANWLYAVLNRVAFADGRDAGGRAIWRSEDGGDTWQPVVLDGQAVPGAGAAGTPDRVTLTGGTRVFVAPDDPRRTYFAFGNYFQGYGTDLYRSQDGLATLAASHFEDFYEIFDIAFGPPGSAVRFIAASSDVPRD